MLRIGLTGGMGAGKSTVARKLAASGAVIVDSDVIAREVVAPGTEGLAALVAAFGDGILSADGSLDRPALAARAFADDESRATLNSITHPLVGKRTAELIGAAAPDAIVVQDIPLLVENGLAPFMNLVLVVDVPAETRIRRLVEFRGVEEKDARARISAQATDEQRRAAADVLLDNSGAEGALGSVLDVLWERRLVPFERNLRTGVVAAVTSESTSPVPDRAAQAERLIARLWLACGGDALRIDHVGATATADLPAEDLLEIQITVAAPDVAPRLRDALSAAGFPHATRVDPLSPAVAWHGSADPGRPAEVALRVDGAPEQRSALEVRDLLRDDEAVRAGYRDMWHAVENGPAGESIGRRRVEVEGPWLATLARRER